MYMFTCMHVRVTCACMQLRTCIYACMFEYTYINAYVRACMYRHVYVCASMNLTILLQCDDADDDRDDDDDDDGDGGVNDVK